MNDDYNKNSKYIIPLKKHLYGPVFSWRLGVSLGIDLLSNLKKICNFDCNYCQIGKTDRFIEPNEREIFVETAKIIDEIKALNKDIKMDVLTIAGRGEPTLALNLKEVIEEVKKIRKEKIAVITNSLGLYLEDVRDSLLKVDIVMAKFDAFNDDLLSKINKPIHKKGSIEKNNFEKIYTGLLKFRQEYNGFLELQIMFVDENKDKYKEAFEYLEKIRPDRININTPLRPSKVMPLQKQKIDSIKNDFLKFFAGKLTK
ncbi:MAG: radical SAM protein, partial [Elusimicrobiota bacterium]|nr:radical SAM protein [Elusimicrobiota bacterium]